MRLIENDHLRFHLLQVDLPLRQNIIVDHKKIAREKGHLRPSVWTSVEDSDSNLRRKPALDVVIPRILHVLWADHYYWPLLRVELTPSERFDRFSQPHIISNEYSSPLSLHILNCRFLKWHELTLQPCNLNLSGEGRGSSDGLLFRLSLHLKFLFLHLKKSFHFRGSGEIELRREFAEEVNSSERDYLDLPPPPLHIPLSFPKPFFNLGDR